MALVTYWGRTPRTESQTQCSPIVHNVAPTTHKYTHRHKRIRVRVLKVTQTRKITEARQVTQTPDLDTVKIFKSGVVSKNIIRLVTITQVSVCILHQKPLFSKNRVY